MKEEKLSEQQVTTKIAWDSLSEQKIYAELKDEYYKTV